MRTRSLTTRAIKVYKLVITAILTLFVAGTTAYYASNGSVTGMLMLLPYFWLVYKIWKQLRLLKEVSYDDHSLYIKEQDFEVQIPFYRLKEVKLISLDGIYKFTLREADQFGDVVYCKPSLSYPFTYRKVDDELRELQGRIEKITKQYWQARQENQAPGLPTMNI